MIYRLAHSVIYYFPTACIYDVRRTCSNTQCKTEHFTMLSHTEQVNFTPFKHIVIRDRKRDKYFISTYIGVLC